ncbi:MAG: VCBS repeat-containing protein, partial [Planctomycetes bacterium]|nr:VCBS repeat-containing protein [Planctomycetota bacterium]
MNRPRWTTSLLLLFAGTLLAQEVEPPKSSPPRRRRPQWQASLQLPQDLWRDVTAQTIGETAEWTNKVELADIDGDGLLDILVPEYGGAALHWYSGGFNFSGQAEQSFIGFSGATMARAADLDGDGDLDVVLAALWVDSVILFENSGGGN